MATNLPYRNCAGFSAHRRGTTLIEMLVVIVIFLIGILAVLQVFPKGFQLLVLTRNESVASALARDQVEQLKSHTDQLPENIVSTYEDGAGNLVINPSKNPNDLGPQGDAVDQYGMLSSGGTFQGDWTRFSGANAFRHVIGEGRQIPAPRLVGTGNTMYGGLVLLQFGPIDYHTNTFAVYGNDLTPHLGLPGTNDQVTDDEYFIGGNPQDNTISLGLPLSPNQLPTSPTNLTGTNLSTRTYYLAFSAYVMSGANYVRRDYAGIPVTVSPQVAPNTTGPARLYQVNGVVPTIQYLLQQALPGVTVGSIDLSTLRVRRSFQPIASNADWTEYEPYSFKLLNPNLGVLLFSPSAFGVTIPGPGGATTLQARVDYDVYDWRILREEFRFPAGETAQHQLAIGTLKIGGPIASTTTSPSDFDGRPIGYVPPEKDDEGRTMIVDNMAGLEDPNGPYGDANNDGANEFVLVDMDTGGIYMEKRHDAPSSPGTADTFITVNKSTGLITVKDLDGDPTNGTQADLLLPDGTIQENVTIDNRAVRALYMVKSEFAVQVLKAASAYTENVNKPGVGQFAIGPNVGGAAFRIYFPICDVGQKVTFGVINYRRPGDASPRQLYNQDFVIGFPTVPDGVGLPCADLSAIDPTPNIFLDVSTDGHSFGYAAKDVKGSSVEVRVLWNPNYFLIGNNATPSTTNISNINVWARGWRKTVNQTFLEQGGLIQ